MKKTAFILLAALAILSCRSTDKTKKMDRTRLNIGTYVLQPYARSEQHIRDLADCGIDFVTCIDENDRALLDLFHKYGVGAMVDGQSPIWWGGDGSNAGKFAQAAPISEVERLAEGYVDHPAIWGLIIGDEPSALDFPHYGKVYETVARLHPGTFPYLNLYPNYASVAENTSEQTVNQLGTATYAQHITQYCLNIPSDYICYDFYVYSTSVAKMFENLRVVSDACTWSGKSMWTVLQVNSNRENEWISANQLRYQAYTAMAFGAEIINWACYTAGWWHNQVLDDKGEKTQQYEKLKEVNSEIHALGERYMKYRRISTAFVGRDFSQWLSNANTASVDSYSDAFVEGLRSDDRGPLVVGTFESREGRLRRAVLVVAADDPYDKHNTLRTISFRADNCKRVKVTSNGGKTVRLHPEEGIYRISLPSNSTVLIEQP